MLAWELLFPRAPEFGPRMPFFIGWLACAHPATTNPVEGTFGQLRLTMPEPARLQKVLDLLQLGVEVRQGEPDLVLTITTRRGEVALDSTAETTNSGFG